MEIKKSTWKLTEEEKEYTLDKVVNPIGISAKADIPKKHLNRGVYVIVTKEGETSFTGFFPKADKFESLIYWLTEKPLIN